MVNTLRWMRNGALLLFSALFFACENPADVALNLPGTSPLQTFFTDTLTVQRSTILLDSTSTSLQSQLVVGGLADPLLGYTAAAAFVQPVLPTSSVSGVVPFNAGETPVADSIALFVLTSGYYMGDTTSKITVGVHKLTDKLSTTKSYASDESVAYEPTPLATTTFNVDNLYKTVRRDTLVELKIKLPLSYAQEILKLSGTEEAKTNTAIVNVLKGLALVPQGKPMGLYGLRAGGTASSSSTLRIYYHKQGETSAKNFNFDLSGQRFTRFTQDRKGGVLAGLTARATPLASAKTNGNTYVQSGTGISTLFTFPSLNKLPKNSIINSAVLEVTVDSTLFTNRYQPVTALVMSRLNNTYQPLTLLQRYVSVVAGNPPLAGPFDTKTKTYTIPVTPYVEQVLAGTATQPFRLAAVPAVYNANSGTGTVVNATLNRIAIQKAKLKIYYSTK